MATILDLIEPEIDYVTMCGFPLIPGSGCGLVAECSDKR